MEDFKLLVLRAQMGDQDAYGELVRRFQDMAYGYAYARLGNFQLAEDVAQEAFIEAYQCLPNLREPYAFPAWLKRIVFKHCDRLTRGKRVPTVPLELADRAKAQNLGPAKAAERRELRKQVLEAIASLSEEQRTVTTLYYINGYSQKEIAAFLEVPTTTVKSRLYTSRQRLKERMFTMVQEELRSGALPESFTQETLALAVAKAEALNEARKFSEAEELLRDILDKSPDHSGALKELNRTVMWGYVYNQGRWDLLPELVARGRKILASGDEDDYVYHELARTLLAIPAMPQATAFIERWIDKRGPNLERLGMLAWAQGCMAQYNMAEATWDKLLAMSQEAMPEEVGDLTPWVCKTLVDCFASAGELARAQRIARAAWARCYGKDEVPHPRGKAPYEDARGEFEWPMIFHQAGLPLGSAVSPLLTRLRAAGSPDLETQGMMLSIRAWVEDAEVITAEWLNWVKVLIKDEQLASLSYLLSPTGQALFKTDRLDEQVVLAEATWTLLKDLEGKAAETWRRRLTWLRFNVWRYMERGDLDTAEALTRRAMRETDEEIAVLLVDIAALRGTPSPPELVAQVAEGGVEAIDSYGMEGWYLIAREAAAAGDADCAFDALRRALGYWTNPPLTNVKRWEGDAYWGALREHPEYRRIFDEKRQCIGPIYGDLHYFPGW